MKKKRAEKLLPKNRPSKRVGSGRLVGRFLALKSKQWWEGGFTEYRVFVGDGANRRYLESLRSSAEIVAVEMREVKAPNDGYDAAHAETFAERQAATLRDNANDGSLARRVASYRAEKAKAQGTT